MADPSLKDLLAQSALAFVGTVQSLGQSPEPGLDADARTALVVVEQPLHAPEAIDLARGSAVVVQLHPDLPVLAPGDRATFFADPVIYGATLVVAETARSDEPQAMATAMRSAGAEVSPVREALGELTEERVLEHARTADAVVRATVVALRAAASSPQNEHDRQDWVATLDVDLVAQGEIPGVGDAGGEVEVAYANSLDRRWRTWPKPKAGQSGMWILHRTEGDLASVAPFQLMHPEDLQPSAELDALLGEATDDTGDDTP
jgi:hypothetical protein